MDDDNDLGWGAIKLGKGDEEQLELRMYAHDAIAVCA